MNQLHENVIFLIGAPRSGTTLLQRMLGSHSTIYTHPEPHLLTPLYYLGYFATVDKAPYDHINAAQALRELAQELPGGEADYLDALRAYASTLYERVLAPTGKSHFLDKTPAYALVLPFIAKLYPRAKYVVLTRHPLAVFHSVAQSFFAGDYKSANDTNPILQHYVPAIGRFILEQSVDFVHVQYEKLVQQPEAEMKRVLGYLGLEFQPGVVQYGDTKHITKSYGDPMTVNKHKRPVVDSVEAWAAELAANEEARALAEKAIAGLEPEHVRAWGYSKEELLSPIGAASSRRLNTRLFNSYAFKRRVLLRLRRNIQTNALGSAVKKLRYYCDVLLRE